MVMQPIQNESVLPFTKSMGSDLTPKSWTYNEYPFETILESGQHLRGEMDLLWFYSDERGRHCILVDYKSFPGVDLNEHAKKYYAQLSAYAHALRKADIDVTHTLIYYPVQKCIMCLS